MFQIPQKITGAIILGLIYMGIITTPDQLKGEVNSTSLQHLSGTMEIENGNKGGYSDLEDIQRLLYTGSVVLNRVNSPRWSGNNIEEVVLAKGQYASVTRDNFKTKKATERTIMLAKYLLIYGSIIPENVVYQGQGKNGSEEFARFHVKGDKDELFYYE